ncbi:MAG: glycosyltransferase, partial [Candidatus Ratteibacteria bacterium]|nr:glycosyltransferase [Candidatus Ratteibacteria bacterium]
MNKLKISVVIPTYNAEKTLRDCLKSVLDQTIKNYEIIIVDNNSTDKTKDVIIEFQEKDARVKYAFETKKGRGAARNAGIKIADGDIIAMVDADCIVPSDWLQKIIRPIINENESIVMGGEKNLIKNYWALNIQNANSQFLKRNTYDQYIYLLDTKNFAIRADLIRKLMFDSDLGNFEDLDFSVRLKNIALIRFCPNIEVIHKHKSSFKEVVKLNFDRAYWTYKIYKKHSSSKIIKKEPMFESISIVNFLSFPFWVMLQLITKPITT